MRYLASRLLQGLVVVTGAIAVSFVLAEVAGGPGALLAGVLGGQEEVERINRDYGFDRPLPERFAEYAAGAVRGDFGESIYSRQSAVGEVLDALPYTAVLVFAALALVCVIAIPMAAYSALHRERRLDRALRTATIVGQGIPDFWLAILLILVFAVWLPWLPSFGADGPASIVLPVVALSVPLLSTLIRILRSQLLDIMAMEFTTALRARGLTEREIVWRHGMRNAVAPTVTFLALQLGWLLGGTIVVENVFGWPGIGSLAISSVSTRDLPVIQGLVVVVACSYVLLNLAADLIVLRLDPRIRTGRA